MSLAALASISPPAVGCGGPTLTHAAQHIIITTAVGTPICWRTHTLSLCVSHCRCAMG